MGLSRSGTLFLIGLLVLIALSLHPVASVEAVVDVVFAPSRWLSESTRPLTWIGAKEVNAAAQDGLAAAASERETSRALLLVAQAAALPRDPALSQGRALIGAHVIDRPARRRDVLVLRYPPDAGVVPGLPIVHGDVYVGRVAELNPRQPGECTADLVTAKEFRVAALVRDGDRSAHLIVGGLLGTSKRGGASGSGLRLLVHYPDDRSVSTGDVRVAEIATTSDARLADGFRLGRLETNVVQGIPIPVVKPEIDYAFGLDHVTIVAPPQMATAGPVLAVDPFAEEAWLESRVIVAGDASPARDTRKLAANRADQLRVGAAVAWGARFLGRVERVEATCTDVRLLSDPGLTFNALLECEGWPQPVPLGRVVSLGAVRGGAIEIEFGAAALAEFGTVARSDSAAASPVASGAEPRVGLPAGTTVKARLWTAGGEPEVPPGLLVGAVEFETRAGLTRLRFTPAQDGARAPWMRVWRGLMSVEGEAP